MHAAERPTQSTGLTTEVQTDLDHRTRTSRRRWNISKSDDPVPQTEIQSYQHHGHPGSAGIPFTPSIRHRLTVYEQELLS